MQNVISLLPDSVANQIAAGEVVQRPASIVKELVENSIDAGAKNIRVQVVDAGRTSIQVIDDGVGMTENDARLAFERHATSKIRTASDLFALTTMGFRGEALASIAAVAQVELTTRVKGAELGTRILISGSQLESQEPIVCAEGTNFKIKNLFYNVPARRKFLKSEQTELTNIVAEFERVSLMHLDVEFTLSHNDAEMISLPISSFKQRILNLFGKRLNSQLLPVEVDTTMVKIRGFVGTPESARKKGALQYFFVNERYMRNPYFAKAISEAFSRLVPQGEYVPFFLSLSVDPSRIDVNIHPTKTEIKFEDEQAIWQILAAAARESLGRFNAAPSIDFDTEGMPDIPVMEQLPSSSPVSAPKLTYHSDYNPFKKEHGTPYGESVAPSWEKLYKDLSGDSTLSSPSLLESPSSSSSSSSQESFNTLLPEQISTLPSAYQYKGQYLLLPVKSGLMWIDQRRAHIRVLYEKYRCELKEKPAASQGLLFPERLDVETKEAIVLESMREELSLLGFEFSPLGGNTYSISSVPAGTEGLSPKKLLLDLVHSVMERTLSAKEKMDDNIALTMARQVAMVKGQILSEEEAESLIGDLFKCENSARTPDGKSIVYILSDADINRFF